jgi:hypothetical protein
MSTIISGDTGITFPDDSTQSKAVSQVTPFAVTASAIAGAELQLPEATANGVNYVALKAADTLAANTTFTLPAADGTSGQVLQTNASGVLSFGNVAAANGGTGLTSPGTVGNVLTSNGTGWTSTALPPSGTLEAIASGSLVNGATVVINADGTVSVVAGNVATAGSPVVFESASTGDISAAYDANAQKVVIAYQDTANSSFGTAIVGTVSGTSISFGTPVVFESALTDNTSVAYDATALKVVISYRDDGTAARAGTAIVGTVSGTSISFGTAVVFRNANTTGISSAYDSVQQKVVIAFEAVTLSENGYAIVGTVSGTSISFGTAVLFEASNINTTSTVYDTNAQKIVIASYIQGSVGKAIVGTVSGTSISFGTAVTFSATTPTNRVIITYDSIQQKVVVAYGISGFGNAIVGTVSGTSISFGTAVAFNTGTINLLGATYDANARKVVITYQDTANSNFGTASVGTVSGTSISFEPKFVFVSAAISVNTNTYDSTQQKVMIAYTNSATGFGTAVIFQPEKTNLTTENFIGFSNAAYTNGQTATIQIAGAVDDAQSSLTPGQQYFVQLNGTLGLTAATPSVVAGTAVAATKIIVKG